MTVAPSTERVITVLVYVCTCTCLLQQLVSFFWVGALPDPPSLVVPAAVASNALAEARMCVCVCWEGCKRG